MSDSTTPSKHCKKCTRDFPATSEFWHTRKASPDGLAYICKECAIAKSRKWYADDPERARQAKREYHSTHKDERRVYNARVIDRSRERKRTPEYKAKEAERRKRKRHEINAYNRQYRETHDWRDNWRERNPEKAKAITHRRIAARHNADGTYTAADIRLLYELQEGRCAYCGIPIYFGIPKDVQVDHMHPLSRGGANSPDNLALACPSCNLSKNDKTVAEWMEVRGW